MHSSKPEYDQIGVAMTCRSYAEYLRMFDLPDTLSEASPLLDVAGGASSFTATARAAGLEAYAADPLYRMTADEIERHGAEEIRVSTEKLSRLAEHYDWSYYGDLSRHRANRERSLDVFATDYRDSRDAYVAAQLPELPFPEDRFGLVLCSHFLFLYAKQFDYNFHEAAVRELLRVCRSGGEVRIYPLVSLQYEEYPHLPELLDGLRADGVRCEKRPSKLPFLPKSTDVLVLVK